MPTPDAKALARLIEASYLQMYDHGGGPTTPEQDENARQGHVGVRLTLERLCDLERTDSASVYEALNELAETAPEALAHLAAQAVTELQRLRYRVPRVTCPSCGSEAVDSNSNDPTPGTDTLDCTDCGHAWTLASDF